MSTPVEWPTLRQVRACSREGAAMRPYYEPMRALGLVAVEVAELLAEEWDLATSSSA